MQKIFQLFVFTGATWGFEVARLAVMLVMTLVVAWLTAFVLLLITKKKKHKVAFTNWFKYCLLWAIVAALLALGAVAIITIRYNGIYYFGLSHLGFNLQSGYLLMLPEIILMTGWVVAFFLIIKSIKESI